MATFQELQSKYGATYVPTTTQAEAVNPYKSITDKYGATFTPATAPISTAFSDWTGIQNPHTYWQDALSQVKETIAHPIQTIGNVVKAGIDAFVQPIKSAWKETKEAFSGTTPEGKIKTTAEKVKDTVEALTADVQVAILPIYGTVMATFGMAKQLPVLSEAADVLGIPFATAGQLVKLPIDKFIDVLPISQQDKDTIRPAFDQMGELAGQILLGGKIMNMVVKGVKINKENIKTISTEAKTEAEQIKTTIQKNSPEIANPSIMVQPTKKVGGVPEVPKEDLEAIHRANPELFNKATKAKTLEEFIKNDLLSEKTAQLPRKEYAPQVRAEQPLSQYGNYLYHETNYVNTQNLLRDLTSGYPETLYLSNTPELALGQGGKKGFTFIFDSKEVSGFEEKIQKPSTEFLRQQGKTDELIGKTFNKKSIIGLKVPADFKFKSYYRNADGTINILENTLTKFGLDTKTPIILEDGSKIYIKSQLTDFYNQAVKETTKPTETLPPNIAINQTSYDIIKNAVKKDIIKSGEIQTHEIQKVDDWVKNATDIFVKDPEKATRIAMGEELAPRETPASVFYRVAEKNALENRDIPAILKLNESTIGVEAGRGIKGFDVFNEYSPTDRIKEVQRAVEKRTGETDIKGRKSKLTEEAKTEMAKTPQQELLTKLSDYINKNIC